ncbi:VOC family protein [Acidimangrovimonas sediminis]|uniref:VOC family protein n=1 Tax=Acidimangrovimonas sediminis TaxID=2056283 RepID=UPI000C80B64C|nr:VOC family protein [Acidimangrovimonas sediminis]
MSDSFHGLPCWFELMSPDLDAAKAFYSGLFGWEVTDAGMEGFTYLLAKAEGTMAAGMMAVPEPGMPPFWVMYLAVTDVDAEAEAIRAQGGEVHKAPADIPGTGRFAVVADPQGAVFGLLQPLPMEGGGAQDGAGRAFDQGKAGHGNWLELQTTDQKAALGFYAGRFGWTLDHAMPMGEMGSYDVFAREGTQIGGMMPKVAPVPRPFWLVYFGVNDVAAALAGIEAQGGKVVNGPMEVPGPALVAQARDPQGGLFAVVGPKPA